MADADVSQHLSINTSFTKHTQSPPTLGAGVGRRMSLGRNKSGASYSSWISSLAAPPAPPTQGAGHPGKESSGSIGRATSPPPVPVPFEAQSPTSTLRTIKLTQAPAPHAVHSSLNVPPRSRSQGGTRKKVPKKESEWVAVLSPTESSASHSSTLSRSRSQPHLQSYTAPGRHSPAVPPPTAWAPERLGTGVDRDGNSMLNSKMSTVEEVSEHASTPRSPLRGKARSIVGGFVSGLKNIPRAMTHSQLYDRVSLAGRESHGDVSVAGSVAGDRDHPTSQQGEQGQVGYVKYPGGQHGSLPQPHPQYTIPVYFAPPPTYVQPQMQAHGHAHGRSHTLPFRTRSPFSITGSEKPMSEAGSRFLSPSDAPSRLTTPSGYASDPGNTSTSRRSAIVGLTTFLDELTALPWISPRVSVDYVPGTRARCGGAQEKRGTSWYSVQAPPSPSDISQPWGKLPDPWFPPARLSTAIEADEHEMAEQGRVVSVRERGVGDENGEGGGDVKEKQADIEVEIAEEAEAERDRLKQELQNRTLALQDLRQIVEHQKMALSALESQMADMQRTNEEVLHRRRSSVRHSLRARESVRVSRMSTIRRTSVRLSTRSSSVPE